uniref:Bcr/CflA family efflux transporter n=1 Tax=Candidatus Kentrum sp. LPFa TaxID=2126335 RepID=A0A450XZQ7_9GAMM|nr:MAG: MFS transporter, DHA1 family, bicyclomycin/chloramphenicol resistance protein [Candidatus Kentron sp. LPFa]VFK34742.1 MAG: MFS transporter, DHA1 family, bicyclomycin/chloramphenicol resistance protein [Candidatus Kentron sp. LPFa]
MTALKTEQTMTGQTQPGLIILLAACTALGPISITLYTPSMSAIAAELGATLPAVQNTLALFLLGFGGGHLFIGPISDRFGRRPVILVGMALYGLAGLVCAQTTSIEEMQIARFCQGLLACSGSLIARAVVRDRFEGVKALRMFSFIGTIVALAPALGPFVGGQLQVWFGWRATFYVLAGFGFLLLFFCGVFLRESNINPVVGFSPLRLARTYGGLLRHRSYMGTVFLVGFTFAGFFANHNFLPFLLIGELGIRPNYFGLLVVFIASAFAMGSFLVGRSGEKLSARTLVITGTLVSLLGGLSMILLSGELTIIRVVVPMMIFGLGFGLITPPAINIALAPFPLAAGSASAMLGFIQMGAAGLINMTTGPLYDGTATPLGWIMLGGAGMALLMAYTGGAREGK